jgi:type IV pilus assembly protein PilX
MKLALQRSAANLNHRIAIKVKCHQTGVAMLIVMMFVVILSGIAAFAARRAVSGEGMARNQLDVEVARQAAEAALRDAEMDLQIKTSNLRTNAACSRPVGTRPVTPGNGNLSYFNENCRLGQCLISQNSVSQAVYAVGSNASIRTNPEAWWPNGNPTANLWNNDFLTKPPISASCAFNGGVPLGTFTGTPRLRGVIRQPEYLIEHMWRGDQHFFRITSRGWGLSNNSEVVMQSYFSTAQGN